MPARNCFAKSSVVEVKRLVAETLRFGLGSVTPEKGVAGIPQPKDGRQKRGRRDALHLGRNSGGRGRADQFRADGPGYVCPGQRAAILRFGNEELSEEQRAAVRHILASKDQVVGLRGAAGSGKTTLMREAVAQIEAQGLRVFAFAPSADASRRTLREAGFPDAQTVAHLLINKNLQRETRGQVIWIDEAGLLGVEDMLKIMNLAGDSTRIILTGDTAQHAPVARGDGFRLLQHYAGLRVAEVTEIRRQEREEYRKAVCSFERRRPAHGVPPPR